METGARDHLHPLPRNNQLGLILVGSSAQGRVRPVPGGSTPWGRRRYLAC